jgi:RNA polymerase sigma-70 factor (ECF subfamily)
MLDSSINNSDYGQRLNMEADLIASLDEMKAGQSGAFERFFSLVEKKVFAFGLKVCGHVEDAKDTVQETLLSAFKALPNLDFKDSKALNVWLYKVAKNSCLMMRRKSAYEPERELSLDQFMPGGGKEGGPTEIPDWSNLPDDALLKEELREMVRRATLALPAQYRMALVLRDMEQLSTKEAAEVLGISEQNVKVRLHRARLSLRQELERYFTNSQRRDSDLSGEGSQTPATKPSNSRSELT